MGAKSGRAAVRRRRDDHDRHGRRCARQPGIVRSRRYRASISSRIYRRREAVRYTGPRPPPPPPRGRYRSGLRTVRHSLFALLLVALPLTAEAQNRTPLETATVSHSATNISVQPPAGPSSPHYFLSHKVNVLPDPSSTIFDDTDYARNSGNCTNVPSAVLIAVTGMFGNGHLNGSAISMPMRTCGPHTVGKTFRIRWSGDSSKAWRRCDSNGCGYRRSGTGTPARAYFSFDTGANCQTQSVLTTEMGLVTGATHCWTTVTIQ